MALTIYESEHLCSECGNPKTLCRSGKEFEVATDVCGGMAAVERWQKDNEKSSKDPGTILALHLAGADGDTGMSFVKFDDEK